MMYYKLYKTDKKCFVPVSPKALIKLYRLGQDEIVGTAPMVAYYNCFSLKPLIDESNFEEFKETHNRDIPYTMLSDRMA